jgi:MerR family transcriptional regulator/heat shock protein HspR
MTMARASDPNRAIYIISVAAELAGVHPQTLRVYERKGLLQPQRTQGNTRRYSERDIAQLRKIQELTHEGINLAGVMRIMELENQVERLIGDLNAMEGRLNELTEASTAMAIVPLRDVRRVRRVLKSDQLDRAAKPRTFSAPPIQEP